MTSGAINVTLVLLGSVLLLMGAVAKLAAPRAIAATLSELGISVRRPVLVGRVVGSAELVLGTAIMMARSAAAAVLVVVFGVLAAGAGLRALYLGKEIECNCFGDGSDALGFKQLVLLPFWLAVAWSVLQGTATDIERLVMLATSAALTAIAVVWRLARAVQPLARERLRRSSQSIREGEAW